MNESMSNFTPRAQQVLALARLEADRFHHNFVGTEHLLLGLIALGQGTAFIVLGKMGLNLETVRTEIENQVGTGPDQQVLGNIPYTPRTKRVLALAQREARALNHTYVGTEHILLGLLHEGAGVAPRVLKQFGVDTDQTRLVILKELDPFPTPTGEKPAALPQNPGSPQGQVEPVDTSKRYDVYCSEKDQRVVVYRNVLFKSRSRLLSTGPHDLGGEFLKVEQLNGQVIYLSLFSVVRFCEHGAQPEGEIVP